MIPKNDSISCIDRAWICQFTAVFALVTVFYGVGNFL